MSLILPLPKAEQFELLQTFTNSESPYSELQAAVNRYLAGDWSRRAELFDITSEEFALWADRQSDLQLYHIFLRRGSHDGLYLVPRDTTNQFKPNFLQRLVQPSKPAPRVLRQSESSQWQVYWQERQSADSLETFEDFNSARRYALAQRLDYFLSFDPLRK